MKIKFLIISLLTLLLMSCEEKEWQRSDIQEVPVYNILNLEKNGTPYALEVYREKPLLIEYENSSLLKNYAMIDYVDASSTTDSVFSMSFSRIDSMIVDSVNSEVVKAFTIVSDTASSQGIMSILYIHNNDTIASSAQRVEISADEVYN